MNKYEVIETIGEGAYGVVLKCRNKETNELVAIKRFKESEDDELVRKTTLREVKVLRMLKHETYVVNLIEAFRRKGKLYLVFEYVGCNLLDILDQHPQGVELDDCRRMIFTLLLGVRACHANGVIHRDIKPENLLYHSDLTVRLCDFGFARPYAAGMDDLTDYVATRWYRSPELLLGTTDYGLPSDMWAVGCIMAELLDGQALFPGESELDQLFLIQKLLGNFTPQQVDTFKNNKTFAGYALRDVPRTETTIERKFGRKANKKAIHLLKSLLVIDPTKRLTVDEALQHPFFEGLLEVFAPNLKLGATAATQAAIASMNSGVGSGTSTAPPPVLRPSTADRMAAARLAGGVPGTGAAATTPGIPGHSPVQPLPPPHSSGSGFPPALPPGNSSSSGFYAPPLVAPLQHQQQQLHDVGQGSAPYFPPPHHHQQQQQHQPPQQQLMQSQAFGVNYGLPPTQPQHHFGGAMQQPPPSQQFQQQPTYGLAKPSSTSFLPPRVGSGHRRPQSQQWHPGMGGDGLQPGAQSQHDAPYAPPPPPPPSVPIQMHPQQHQQQLQQAQPSSSAYGFGSMYGTPQPMSSGAPTGGGGGTLPRTQSRGDSRGSNLPKLPPAQNVGNLGRGPGVGPLSSGNGGHFSTRLSSNASDASSGQQSGNPYKPHQMPPSRSANRMFYN